MIGVAAEHFRVPVKQALRFASELGYRAVEISCADPETSPRNLSASGRRHLLRYCDNLGLTICSINADFPGLRLTDPSAVDERIARSDDAIVLASDLGVDVVSSRVGQLAHVETDEPLAQGLEGLSRLGDSADHRRVRFAIRPSVDSAQAVSNVLTALHCPGIAIGLDPAECVMSGVNPLAIVERWVGQVALVHARDAKSGRVDRPGIESPLGAGDVDYLSLFAMLHGGDYRGPIVVRREDAAYPMEELAQARGFIRDLLYPHG